MAAVLGELLNGGQQVEAEGPIFVWVDLRCPIGKLLQVAAGAQPRLQTVETVEHLMVRMLCRRRQTELTRKVDVVVRNLQVELVVLLLVAAVIPTMEAVEH